MVSEEITVGRESERQRFKVRFRVSVNIRGELKKTITKDTTSPNMNNQISESTIADYESRVLNTNIEEWIDLIPDHTFETKFLELSIEDAQLFISSYKILEEEKKRTYSRFKK